MLWNDKFDLKLIFFNSCVLDWWKTVLKQNKKHSKFKSIQLVFREKVSARKRRTTKLQRPADESWGTAHQPEVRITKAQRKLCTYENSLESLETITKIGINIKNEIENLRFRYRWSKQLSTM
jgi:hypothetical protein